MSSGSKVSELKVYGSNESELEGSIDEDVTFISTKPASKDWLKKVIIPKRLSTVSLT